MSSHTPTTREIAAATGYSPATVSHALRDNPKISQPVRTLIQKAAARMGWRPNPLVSAYMAHYRSARPPGYQASLAYFISNPVGGKISDLPRHMRRHFEGAKQRAQALGYNLEAIWLNEPGLTSKRLNSILSSRGIPGVMVPGVVEPAALFESLDWSGFASIAMGFSPSKSKLHRLSVDTNAGFIMVLRRARDLGYRRIAVAVSAEYDDLERQGVYQAACYLRDQWEREGADSKILICYFPTSGEGESEKIEAWLKEHRPDAVLGEHVTWQTICRMGWKVPNEVAFMTVDRSSENPAMGGFDQRHDVHGVVAIDMLVSQVNHNERGLPAIPRVTLIAGAWVDGPSIPPRADVSRAKPINIT